MIDAFVNYLTHANEVAKLGAALGPYLMAIVTGSGDAATFAFNEAVTPHAAQFGMSIDSLGLSCRYFGQFRSSFFAARRRHDHRCPGSAGVSPFEIVKRTAPVMFICLVGVYFLG